MLSSHSGLLTSLADSLNGWSALTTRSRQRCCVALGLASAVVIAALLALPTGRAPDATLRPRTELAPRVASAAHPRSLDDALPAYPAAQRVLSRVQVSAGENRVELRGLAVGQASPAGLLAQEAMTLEMRGSYRGIKTVLADALGRHAFVRVRRLVLQTSDEGTSVHARVELVLFSRGEHAASAASTAAEGRS